MAFHPTFRSAFAVALAGSTLALPGCDGGTGPGDSELTSEDANAIAAFVSDMDFLSLGLTTLTSTTGGRTLGRTANCPAGGTVSVNGSSESSTNQDTHVVSTKWTSTQTHTACAITYTRGDAKATTVVDGSVTTSGSSSYKLPETRGTLGTLLSWSSTTVGSTTTKTGDKTTTCAVDLKQSWDPVKKAFTVSGVMCGRQVNTTWGTR